MGILELNSEVGLVFVWATAGSFAGLGAPGTGWAFVQRG